MAGCGKPVFEGSDAVTDRMESVGCACVQQKVPPNEKLQCMRMPTKELLCG